MTTRVAGFAPPFRYCNLQFLTVNNFVHTRGRSPRHLLLHGSTDRSDMLGPSIWPRQGLPLLVVSWSTLLLLAVVSQTQTRGHENPIAYDASSAAPPLLIVITGCTLGLGRGLAEAYRAMGHVVACCGRREQELRELRASFGAPHLFSEVDVTEEAEVQRFAAEVRSSLGLPDAVIANAGVGVAFGPLWEVPSDAFRQVFDVNVVGIFLTIKHFAPLLLEGARADAASATMAPPRRLITLSSGKGHSSSPTMGAYSASKWAVEALTKSVAESVRDAGLAERLVVVPFAPGLVQTALSRFNPRFHPLAEWAPRAAPFLLSLGVADSGASMSLPGFYPAADVAATWVLPDGMPLPS